jgi:hypothetical protein
MYPCTRRLHFRRADGLPRLLDRRVEAEGPVDEADIVVDGLRHAHDRNVLLRLGVDVKSFCRHPV